MKGYYTPINDNYGIIGFSYHCPECKTATDFTACEDGCSKCLYSEPYTDPDEWYGEEMKKEVKKRNWNLNKEENE